MNAARALPRAADVYLAPRGLTKEEAAHYCGVSMSAFSNWVARKIMPGPIAGTQRWDRVALDHAFDRHAGITRTADRLSEADLALEEWKRQRGQG